MTPNFLLTWVQKPQTEGSCNIPSPPSLHLRPQAPPKPDLSPRPTPGASSATSHVSFPNEISRIHQAQLQCTASRLQEAPPHTHAAPHPQHQTWAPSSSWHLSLAVTRLLPVEVLCTCCHFSLLTVGSLRPRAFSFLFLSFSSLRPIQYLRQTKFSRHVLHLQADCDLAK